MNEVSVNNFDVGVEHWRNCSRTFDQSFDLPKLYPLRS